MLLYGLFFAVILSVSSLENDLKIRTTSGTLLGKRTKTLGRSLKLFLGVPYAQSPIGNLRFKPPLILRDETTERNTSQFGPSCYQPPHLASVMSPLLNVNKAEISEDCLYLNIYVPDVKGPLPVMVWLPGEGFDYADAQQFDGTYLAAEGKVIVVTVNYRLSVFGFLSTLSEEAPGNVGLLDQRMALRWVKENIARFGGRSDDVTLFGRFTGSMSAAIHAFSPLSKNEKLFQRIILQSGIPVGDWAFDRKPLNATYTLAEATNCLFPHVSDIVACLRHLPVDILSRAALSLSTRWRPTYDFHLIYEDTLKAVTNLDNIDIDIMIGINNNEGSLCTIALKAMQSPLYIELVNNSLLHNDFVELIRSNMFDFFKTRDSFLNLLTTYKYNSKKSLRESFVEFCGDLLVISHSQKLADEVAKKNSNLYMYEFSHRPSFSVHPSFIKAAHGDDVLFSMGLPLKLTDLPKDEVRLTRRMVEAVTNFARTGNPNPIDSADTWFKYTVTNHQVMFFSTSRDRGHKKVSHEDSSIFWHTIIPAAQQRLSHTYSTRTANHQQTTVLCFPDYIAISFVFIIGFLLFMFILTVILIIRLKKRFAFQRLV